MLGDALIISGIVLLVAILLVKGAMRLLYVFYFSPGSPHRRRMPRWLIVCVLVSFLILPKIETDFLVNRDEKKPAQVA
jgi:hypothetical protein